MSLVAVLYYIANGRTTGGAEYSRSYRGGHTDILLLTLRRAALIHDKINNLVSTVVTETIHTSSQLCAVEPYSPISGASPTFIPGLKDVTTSMLRKGRLRYICDTPGCGGHLPLIRTDHEHIPILAVSRALATKTKEARTARRLSLARLRLPSLVVTA